MKPGLRKAACTDHGIPTRYILVLPISQNGETCDKVQQLGTILDHKIRKTLFHLQYSTLPFFRSAWSLYLITAKPSERGKSTEGVVSSAARRKEDQGRVSNHTNFTYNSVVFVRTKQPFKNISEFCFPRFFNF